MCLHSPKPDVSSAEAPQSFDNALDAELIAITMEAEEALSQEVVDEVVPEVSDPLESHEDMPLNLGIWQECGLSHFDFYVENLLKQSDQYIVDFFNNEYPDNAIPILNKGVDWCKIKRMVDIEFDHPNLPVLIPEDCEVLHFRGDFYVKPDKSPLSNRICYYCTQYYDEYNINDFNAYRFPLRS